MHNTSLVPQEIVTTPFVENPLALHRAGQLDRAEKAYREILDARPFDVGTLYMLGVLYLQRSDIESAIERFDAVLVLNPNHADCLNDRGTRERRRGRRSKLLSERSRVCVARRVGALQSGQGEGAPASPWRRYAVISMRWHWTTN